MQVVRISPSLSALVGKFINEIDTSSYIRLQNKYYWIAGIDSPNFLIFGRVFYTVDDDSGTRVLYFSHWIPAAHDRMYITPYPDCSLHCLNDDKGLLALKTVGGKLLHRSYLSILPSYRCLQLFQMTVQFLLGFSELYILEKFEVPEKFEVLTGTPIMQSTDSSTPPPDPYSKPDPAFTLRSGTIFHISGFVHTPDPFTSFLVCAWVQALDEFILDSGIFSCLMISPYIEVAELTFINYVLNSLSLSFSVKFISSFKFDCLFMRWCDASPVRRTRLKYNTLWSCISELLHSRQISCEFVSFQKDSIPFHSKRALDLIKGHSWINSLQLVPLMDDIFPLSLCTMGLFTGYNELLSHDPVKLAIKVSSSPQCKQTYKELLSALRNIASLGLPDLLLSNDSFSFSAS
ncbi:unnamed protein product [Rhizophagus irregularis]|nr:unnamed protein product [Rhizophagus irregularis]